MSKSPHDSATDDSQEVKLVKGNYSFLTFTLDDRHQGFPQNQTAPKTFKKNRSRSRVMTVIDDFETHVIPVLEESLSEFDWTLEISEAFASKNKHYPRLHFHVLGRISQPIYLLLELGYLFYRLDMGYHVIPNLNEEQFNQKASYLKKQRAQWSQYIDTYHMCRNAKGSYKETL